MYLPPSRRSYLVLALILAVALFTLFAVLHQTYSPRPSIDRLPILSNTEAPLDIRIESRIKRFQRICKQEEPFEREYGRMNLRMSRAYEGSHHRLKQLMRKALRGEPVTIAAIGGSITKGHAVWENEAWFWKFGEWFDDFVGGDVAVTRVNGAAPATGSDYFSFCFPLHIPEHSDLVLVELAVNDEGIPEHVDNMENLLRGLLDMPNQPAVILVEALAFSSGGMGGGGGRMHLPVAQYFDVPVVNHRHPLANHFGRYPQLVRPYFSENYWGDPDTRHINARGHRDLAMLVASLLRIATCEMVARPADNDEILGLYTVTDTYGDAPTVDAQLLDQQASWPEQSRSWRGRQTTADESEYGVLMPGMWMSPLEYGLLPRMRVLGGWNPDPQSLVPPFHPTCLSTRSVDPRFNLTPTMSDGWEPWVHPEHLDKPYLISRLPGSSVSFDMETSLGVVKMYSLRSMTYGLGMVECWADGERPRAVKVDGWWDNGELNIGRFATIRDDLSSGKHTITCELLSETSDPGGGTEFRMISLMSV